ncbi:MAG: hypothetical protein WC314_25795 [Vulcanimicrobiota bacterium]
MSELTALQQFVTEMEAGRVNLAEVTESSLLDLKLTNRERAIILSGQVGLIKSVAAGNACIEEVKLELSPESLKKIGSV